MQACLINAKMNWVYGGGSRIPSRMECQQSGGTHIRFYQIIQKTAWNWEKFWAIGACWGHSLRSATVYIWYTYLGMHMVVPWRQELVDINEIARSRPWMALDVILWNQVIAGHCSSRWTLHGKSSLFGISGADNQK